MLVGGMAAGRARACVKTGHLRIAAAAVAVECIGHIDDGTVVRYTVLTQDFPGKRKVFFG